MTLRQDFTIDAGRDYGVLVNLTEADQQTPLNLLGCELQWTVTQMTGTAALVTKTSTIPTEIEVTSVADGLLVIHIDQADTDELGELTCEHELIVTDSGGAEATVMQGLLTIMRSLVH
jgi:hypothetical protein